MRMRMISKTSTVINHLRKHLHTKMGGLPEFAGLTVLWEPINPFNNEATLPDNDNKEVLTLPTRIAVPDLDDKGIRSPHLIESQFHLISSRNDPHSPWLTRMTHNFDFFPKGETTVHNPFNLKDYLLSNPRVRGIINVDDCNLVQLAKPWCLHGQLSDGHVDTVSKKVVGGWNFNPGFNFAVLVQLVGDAGLVFRRDDEDWVRFDSSSDIRVLDVAYHNGKFYAFELESWRVGVIDPDKSEISMEFLDAPGYIPQQFDDMACVSIDGCCYFLGGVHFVSCNERLYLVLESVKDDLRTTTMLVFFLDEKEGVWERVSNIGDETLFIGYDVSFGVSSSSRNLPNWNPGSICLFTSPFPLFYDGYSRDHGGMPEGVELLKYVSFPEYWRYLRMYNMNEDERGIVPFKKLSMEKYTGLFFPPPAWVKWQRLYQEPVMLHNIKFNINSTTIGYNGDSDDGDAKDDDNEGSDRL